MQPRPGFPHTFKVFTSKPGYWTLFRRFQKVSTITGTWFQRKSHLMFHLLSLSELNWASATNQRSRVVQQSCIMYSLVWCTQVTLFQFFRGNRGNVEKFRDVGWPSQVQTWNKNFSYRVVLFSNEATRRKQNPHKKTHTKPTQNPHKNSNLAPQVFY